MSVDPELEARFQKAVWLIRNGPKRDSDNDTKLTFYAHFKQARRLPAVKPWGCLHQAYVSLSGPCS